MRSAALLLLTCASLHGAIQLRADRATIRQAALSWTGTGTQPCRLERKGPNNTWPVVATSTEGKASDTTIGPYGTYTYRVSCASAASNEVTIGPPPLGFHLITAKPDKHSDSHYGRQITAALDSNGDPCAAFVFQDPDNDGHYDDTQVLFQAWDRAAYKWKPPVTIATVGNFDPRAPMVGLSLAHDSSNDAFAIVWITTDFHTVNMAVSRDGGATWSTKPAFTEGRAVMAASIAMAGGKAHLAFHQSSKNAVRYMSGSLDDDPAKWQASFSPIPAGSPGPHNIVHLALDGEGKPAVVFWARPAKENVSTLSFWRPGSDKAVTVADNGPSHAAPAGVLLAFGGTQPRVVIDSHLDAADPTVHFSLSSDDAGATWGKPVIIPDDGNQRLGGYMSFAVAPNGSAAFGGDVIGGNFTGMRCSWPKLSRTTDFKSWSTCSAQGSAGMDTRTLWGTVIYNPAGTLYMFFQNRQVNPKQPLPPGLMIWGQ